MDFIDFIGSFTVLKENISEKVGLVIKTFDNPCQTHVEPVILPCQPVILHQKPWGSKNNLVVPNPCRTRDEPVILP